jgi:hypothetical protein
MQSHQTLWNCEFSRRGNEISKWRQYEGKPDYTDKAGTAGGS